MARRAKQRGNSRSVDFSKAGLPFKPDEDVHIKVKSAEWKDGEKGDYIAIEFTGADGSGYETASGYHNSSSSEKALFRMRELLEALGYDVPKGPLDIDTDDLVDLECIATTFEDEYEKEDGSKGRSIRFEDFRPVGKATPKKAAAKKTEEEEEEEEEEPVKKTRGKAKAKEPEEEEEEEAPVKKGRGKAKPKEQTWTEDEIQEMDEDQLQEVIDAADLKVDLDEHKVLRKKKNAVIDALSEAERLDG